LPAGPYDPINKEKTMIEVILLEKIERLGTLGAVVKVKPGFARNFLLPQKKALRATKANLELFEKQRAELEAHNVHLRTDAEALAGKIDGMKVVVIRQASDAGHLYGSVSARDISEAAKEAGETIERSAVQIGAPIKALGLYPVKVRLHPEVAVSITVNVARSPEEAVVQAQKHEAKSKVAAKQATAEAEVASVEAIGEEKGEKKAKKTAKAKKAEGAEPAEETEESAAPKKTRKPKAKKAEAE
jgi:large subunit ribosomal protein L9